MNLKEKNDFLITDDVSDWAKTCIALHRENAEHYALIQVEKMKNYKDSHGAAFWLQVAVTISNLAKK